MNAGFFGLGGMEILILAILGLFALAGAAGAIVLIVALTRQRRPAAEPQNQLADEVRRLRAEIAELKKDRA